MSLLDFEKEPAKLVKLALRLPARLFRTLSGLRGHLYDRGVLSSVKSDLPVISIGNLTTGGTGKTPIVSYLTEKLSARGFNVSIVSRGYGGSESGPALVPSSAEAADPSRFGDEPTWLAQRHRRTPVVIGARRPEAIQFLKDSVLKTVQPKTIVLADDAFQHRRLSREIDVVVIDASAPAWHYEPLPLGRMREDFSALARADFVFLSKVSLANTMSLTELRSRMKSLAVTQKFQLVEFGVALDGVVPLDRATPQAKPLSRWLSTSGETRVVLLSGLARPQTFEDLLSRTETVEIVKHFKFSDHARWSETDLRAIENFAIESGADAIVMTEKDAVKLKNWRPKKPCFVTVLRAEPLKPDELGGFYEAVDRLS